MRIAASLVIGALLIVVGLDRGTSPSAAPGQKPTKQRTIHIDGGRGAPPTLEQWWAISPLVVDATVQRDRPLDRTLSNVPDTVIQTAYELHVNEVFRDVARAADKRVEFVQRGGDRDNGDYIDSVEEEGFPRLRVGERYVFFLKPSRYNPGTYVTATDTPDSLVLLAPDGRVIARGHSNMAAKVERFNREELLNFLRSLKEVVPVLPG